MNEISDGKRMLEGEHFFKTDTLTKCIAPH